MLFPVYLIMGANTEVGKTLFSQLLLAQFLQEKYDVFYLKPVQTGPEKERDSSIVAHAFHKGQDANTVGKPRIQVKSFFSYSASLSPHRAAQAEKNIVTDKEILGRIENYFSHEIPLKNKEKNIVFIESAGGVASPTPEGNLQCQLYRPLRLPVILVADFRLGGISTTISSYELLRAHGFDISCILCLEGEHENGKYLENYYKKECPVFTFENFTPSFSINTQEWSAGNKETAKKVTKHLRFSLQNRLARFSQLENIALNHVWWPFTQHKRIENVQIIDSAFSDTYQIYNPAEPSLREVFDASASWWTQGLGHGHYALARASAYGAGRYGHVLFPGHIHDSAARLVERLLSTVGRGWASRVFFSDNGATAVEIALKMAFRTALVRAGKRENPPRAQNIFVLGLKDSYHGDTLGAMNATSPSAFKWGEAWYQPQGIWLDYPQVFLKEGLWHITGLYETPEIFSQRREIFSAARLSSGRAALYRQYIQDALKTARVAENHSSVQTDEKFIGALILEPLIQGSHGMIFIDPLYQRILIEEAQKEGIPVILDEVFTGFWRLGSETARDLLDVVPDIACYAKQLTGGLVPLSVTLATQEVFQNFYSENIADALLHGHSYTAHPVGCEVALSALELYESSPWLEKETRILREVWPNDIVLEISKCKNIAKVVVLGTLLAIEVCDSQAGYLSLAAKEIVKKLNAQGIAVRPLGNVLYFLANFSSVPEKLSSHCKIIFSVLKRYEPEL